jgi:hypothetical protein
VIVPATIKSGDKDSLVKGVGNYSFGFANNLASLAFAHDCDIETFDSRCIQNSSVTTLTLRPTSSAIYG